MSKIYQEDVSSFCLELHSFIENHPSVGEEEYYDWFQNFVEQRFEKFWPQLYDGEYQNYN